MIDIFISYSRKDQAFVEWIKPILKRLQIEENLNYYQDVENISPGEDFSDSINSAIGNAKVIICFLSHNYFASEFVYEKEVPFIEQSFNKGVKIIPILVDNVYIRPETFFNKIQRVDLGGKYLSEINDVNHSPFISLFEKILREEFNKFPSKPKDSLQIRYNLVVVGKAGVGKSELINYLFGEQVVRSGIGNPVTQLGFHKIDFNISDIPASIYDSAGLEVGSYEKWKKTLDDELRRRGPTEPIRKWFHTVLYCVQATGSRIEPFEVEIINQFLSEKYKVIIAITKSYIGKKKIDELSESIKNSVGVPIECVYINSLDEEIGDTTIKKFGKAQLSREIQISLVQSLTDRIPARCIGFMSKYIDEKCDEQIRYINNYISELSKNYIAKNVERAFQNLLKEINSSDGYFKKIILNETRNTLSAYSEIAGIMDQSIFLEEKSFVSIESKNVEVPKTKSFGAHFEKVFNDFYDWDYTEEYGTVVEVASKLVALPLALLAGFIDGLSGLFEENKKWQDEAIAKVNYFREDTKEKLIKKEEDIKRLYVERLRNLEM